MSVRVNKSSQWCVYILKCGDGTLYTGSTNRLEERIQLHQTGLGAKYTRSHLPVEVVFTESVTNRSAALKREAEIKKLSRTQKVALVATYKSIVNNPLL